MAGKVQKVAQLEINEITKRRRLQIVRAAAKLFSNLGYHSTSMRAISKECGINLAQLYDYIGSKNEILYLFYNFIFEKIYALFNDLEELRIQHPTEQLKYIIFKQIEVVQAYKKEFMTMYTETRHLEGESLRLVLSMESKFVQMVEKIIFRGIKEKVFRECDAFLTANITEYLLMFGPLRGWNIKGRYSSSDLADFISQMILDFLDANTHK